MILQNVLAVANLGKKPEAKRSDEWPRVRKQWLKDHPSCAACGETRSLEVHHKEPFHLHPEKELDPTNFITLCEIVSGGVLCHLHVGHLGSWKSFNVNVVQDAANDLAKIKNRP
jgi:hypothetical protein